MRAALQMMEPLVRGPIYKDSPLTVRAPAQFFDCLTGSLITEPVRLRRSPCSTQGRTFDRRSLQEWFRKYPGEAQPSSCKLLRRYHGTAVLALCDLC